MDTEGMDAGMPHTFKTLSLEQLRKFSANQ